MVQDYIIQYAAQWTVQKGDLSSSIEVTASASVSEPEPPLGHEFFPNFLATFFSYHSTASSPLKTPLPCSFWVSPFLYTYI